MRIGEIAGLVGITARAVRHYHHLGLLPEPRRLANGYRDYSLRDAVLLARIRRLTELGLGLDEVRDVLAADAGKELVEVLQELDADLARQQEEIGARRERLGRLLEQARAGRLPAEGPVSPGLAELFADLTRASAGLPGPEPAMAARDREMLTLLDTVMPAQESARLLGAMRRMTEEPGAMERAYDVYARLDALGDADAGDVRVEEAARALAALLPDEVVGHLPDAEPARGSFQEAFFADFSAAQAEVVRRAMRIAAERAR
ncbi:MerR family transcriptional regulator [Streptomyces sp. WAC05374]|uniref:MerR family transcriptional regulator n=1 Tax=Streptomyces sp. WAC05374 TaxID=2487420 RepID=UPI000F86D2FC|nr:MerR family transcriptional regulator [Streptomyces sp. WAC05374]RST19300.1 MerR family transcriptional regulator [Streptomyces sp. WAC05374]TDF47706.1 MerR family transcriptional regulator [Streptomyces sp. WAC05374]TDF48714.1 MerR family transcriptional regulator [Streptomyces sp. WAC05374]TDF59036.1 MerR family transcriptional regulator [Streptomyces sp. WAC05374]